MWLLLLPGKPAQPPLCLQMPLRGERQLDLEDFLLAF
jgi:hypothetical protein